MRCNLLGSSNFSAAGFHYDFYHSKVRDPVIKVGCAAPVHPGTEPHDFKDLRISEAHCLLSA